MRVVVGRIGRAQGIRGEVTVEVRFSPGAVLLLSGRAGLPASITVAGHRWQNARLILSVEGIEDRTAAETLRGAVLEAEVDLTETAEDEFHDLALVGLAVRQLDGTQLGRISEVLHLPGQDVLAVARTDGAELLVPFVRQIVPEVDIPGGFVVVELPDGLAELA
ncbi:MAG: ribosome maturation factor RimM [Candidatus Nanopelagicales bacterium]|nr:ribosome maturation factor RimM [Candidatus Nanopelagicales bacterium]